LFQHRYTIWQHFGFHSTSSLRPATFLGLNLHMYVKMARRYQKHRNVTRITQLKVIRLDTETEARYT
jgi:hypothetical protein